MANLGASYKMSENRSIYCNIFFDSWTVVLRPMKWQESLKYLQLQVINKEGEGSCLRVKVTIVTSTHIVVEISLMST